MEWVKAGAVIPIQFEEPLHSPLVFALKTRRYFQSNPSIRKWLHTEIRTIPKQNRLIIEIKAVGFPPDGPRLYPGFPLNSRN